MTVTANNNFASRALSYSESLIWGLDNKSIERYIARQSNRYRFIMRVKDSCTNLDSKQLNLYTELNGM